MLYVRSFDHFLTWGLQRSSFMVMTSFLTTTRQGTTLEALRIFLDIPDPWADPTSRSISDASSFYTIEVFQSRIGGSTFWILPGVWVYF